MNAVLGPMSPAEFLTWEEQQELRYEFDGSEIEAMVGGTLGHGAIQVNLAIVLGSAVRGRPCRYYGGDVKLQVGSSWSYPDGMVVCVPSPMPATFVTEPTILFEVLSDSTMKKDYSVKNDEYRSIPSVRRYVMLEQDRIAATVFAREDDSWLGRRLVGPDAVLQLPEIDGPDIVLKRLYEGLDMEMAAAG